MIITILCVHAYVLPPPQVPIQISFYSTCTKRRHAVPIAISSLHNQPRHFKFHRLHGNSFDFFYCDAHVWYKVCQNILTHNALIISSPPLQFTIKIIIIALEYIRTTVNYCLWLRTNSSGGYTFVPAQALPLFTRNLIIILRKKLHVK